MLEVISSLIFLEDESGVWNFLRIPVRALITRGAHMHRTCMRACMWPGCECTEKILKVVMDSI